MLTRPVDLTDADVANALRVGWSIGAPTLTYAPLGFGSHHWFADEGDSRWFVTVDDLAERRVGDHETAAQTSARLTAALSSARLLRDHGLRFVVAPVPSASGDLVRRLNTDYTIAVYPFVDGESHEFGAYPDRRSRLAVVDRLVTIHAATEAVTGTTLVDELAIPRRLGLDGAIEAGSDSTWGPGPYADAARALVGEHRAQLREVLGAYDELAKTAAARPERFVVTHGEPHRGNTIDTPDGVLLIDWDTTLLAPPERDLWSLFAEDPEIVEAYSERSGTDVDHEALLTYRLWWDLCEISLYVDQFRHEHDDTEDTRLGWEGLVKHLDPNRWVDVQ